MAPPEPVKDTFTLPNGHVLQYAIYGDTSASTTVFFHHGLPGCHVEASVFDEPARRQQLRIIAIDRPGMGRSTFQPNYRLLDWPASLLALADSLKIDRFALLGVSGGAPYLLACLHELDAKRCVGAGIIAGVYPASLGYAGMAFETRFLFNMGAWSPWLVEKTLESMLGSIARDAEHPEKLEQFLEKTFESRPPADKAAWKDNTGGCRDSLVEDSRQALEKGSKGAAWEFYLAPNDWGFKLEDITLGDRKLIMWHGALDANWPVAMAEKASVLLKGSELRVSEVDGHVSVFANKVEEVTIAMSELLSS